ncbi:MAG: YicC/YloC family endoribonuclease [Clostridium cochlearium]|uniref:YicC/YloC family endoribonuclease n=1 Tax=Clostridium cochlearium TaxID=1494 RepID=UPI00280BBFFC|nr:YicC/YloC family endoribonuclease [Clostridium cochlearium]MDU1442282.1 YicC/YloC family endoribonuclease [Clostridium cochlearium]
MVKSMTGFGRATFENEKRSFVVEIKSVNHRYCDINIKMPRSLIQLEQKIREIVQKYVGRGKIDVFINLNTYDKSNVKTIFNKDLADGYVKNLEEIKSRYNISEELSIDLIAKFPEVITIEHKEEDIDELWVELNDPLEEAAISLVKMREVEGAKLKENILEKCDNIKETCKEVEKIAPQVVTMYKEKLELRLEELLKDVEIDEERLAMEVALFADKSCIDEEIVRLKSHLIQVKDTLNLEEPIGRKLDFIVQEMNREVNTIASKANNLDISNFVLTMKNEIEKIREQIQNIE